MNKKHLLRKYFPYFIACYTLGYYCLIFFSKYNEQAIAFCFLFSFLSAVVSSLVLSYIWKQEKNLNKKLIWLTLLLGSMSFTIAEFGWFYYDFIVGVDIPFPSFIDFFYILQMILFLIAIKILTFVLFKDESKLRGTRLIFDLFIIMTVVLTLAQHYIISPMLSWSNVPLIERLILVTYPAVDITIIMGITLIYLQLSKSTFKKFNRLFAIAMLFWVVADSVYFYLMINGTYETPHLVDPLWSVGILFVGYSSLYSPSLVLRKIKNKSIYEDKMRLLLPYVSVGILFLTLLLHTTQFTTLMIGTATAIILIVIRQIITLLDNQKLLIAYETLSNNLELKVKSRTDELELKNKQLLKTLKQVEYIANHDSLTNLANRRKFEQCLKSELLEAKMNEWFVAVLFIDLDRFKNINDSLGHDTGDQLLQLVSKRLKYVLSANELVSRQGGDEFTIMIPCKKQPEILKNKVSDIEKELRKPFVIKDHDVYITPSIGISIFPYDGSNVTTLMKNADIAMYRAKENGKNQSCYYSDKMNDVAWRTLKIEAELNKAIINEEFKVYYQPQFDIYTRKLTGAEALIRWNHPTEGIVSPGHFIDIAEESSLIVPMGEWVLENACLTSKYWGDKYHLPFRISVNLSPRQFNEANIVQRIEDIVNETGIDPSLVMLELTENIALYNEEEVHEKLQQLKTIGFKIAIDDFGTGYSSPIYLKKYPIDTLKIAQVFVKDLRIDSDMASIIKSIIAMAKSLKLHLVAEGVETEDQLLFLHSHDCDEVQGYLLGRPVDEKTFEKLYLKHMETM